MTGRRATVALIAAGVAIAVALGVAASAGPSRPRSFDDRVDAVASTLRCPVCQNLSVADSPSGLAGEMRRTIAERLRDGASPATIRREFVEAYGPWILQAPPKEGVNLVAWLAPAIGLLVGAGVLLVAGRSRARISPAEPAAPSAADRRRVDRALAEGPR